MQSINLTEQLLVEKELAKCSVFLNHLAEGGDMAGELALSVVLFWQEVTGQVVHQLFAQNSKLS